MNRHKKTMIAVLGISVATLSATLLLRPVVSGWTHRTISSSNIGDQTYLATLNKTPSEQQNDSEVVEPYVSEWDKANSETPPKESVLCGGESVLLYPKGRTFTTPQGMVRRYRITVPEGWMVVRQEIHSVSWWKGGWGLLLRNKKSPQRTIGITISEWHTYRVKSLFWTKRLWTTKRGLIGYVSKDSEYLKSDPFREFTIAVAQPELPDRQTGEVSLVLDVIRDTNGKHPVSAEQLRQVAQEVFGSLRLLSPKGFAPGMEDTKNP